MSIRSLALVAFTLGLGDTPVAQASEIQLGLARVDITPPIGGKTTGYTGAPATDGVYDPVDARILVLKSPQSTVAIVSCDLCVFSSPSLHEQVKALGVDRLLLMNTHTHAGPDMSQDDFPNADEPWRRTVEQRIVTAVKDAQANLAPAFFAVDEGAIPLGYNRLVPHGDFAETHFENPDHIPYGPIDPTVGVIRITDEAGAVRAVLVTYACHPVVLGPRNAKISADYPGVMRREVEKSLGNNAMCVFIQGGAGDINPLSMARDETRDADQAQVERMGNLLAQEVQKTLEQMKDRKGTSDSLACAFTTIEVANRFDPDQKMSLGVTSLLINGDTGIITMPGEPFHRFQVDIRDRARLPHAFLFGYCCDDAYDWPGYLPDLVSAARGGYGASDSTRVEVGAGERLVNLGLAQLYTLRGHLKPRPQRHIFEESDTR